MQRWRAFFLPAKLESNGFGWVFDCEGIENRGSGIGGFVRN